MIEPVVVKEHHQVVWVDIGAVIKRNEMDTTNSLCTECGAPITDESGFCRNCGNRAEDQTPLAIPPIQAKLGRQDLISLDEQKTFRRKTVAGIAAIILIMCVGLFREYRIFAPRLDSQHRLHNNIIRLRAQIKALPNSVRKTKLEEENDQLESDNSKLSRRTLVRELYFDTLIVFVSVVSSFVIYKERHRKFLKRFA